MKRNISKKLVCLLLVFVLAFGGSSSVYAKVVIYTTSMLESGRVRAMLRTTEGEYRAGFQFYNLKKKKFTPRQTRKKYIDYWMAKNTWYKVSCFGYDEEGNQINKRTSYLCRQPEIEIRLYGLNHDRFEISWPNAYGSTRYLVYMSFDEGKTYRKVQSNITNFYRTPPLNLGQNYYFYVRAVKEVGSRRFYSAKPYNGEGVGARITID